ncbi:type VI secretion system ImpA family N-terminal domain-containing protein [Motilimonas sp. E26]|uniref:type VI secretion system protein TssA n=1 Tax=Motilimonas sp. E26 TaxID=2865674 RepID=UPI001E40FAC4|nr:type VI secretion system ImpA family N-terminal domain-containing protein [Motilimonas sp. E26]MCE0557543.1 type VI secretion system ImpA family N-terminal domain-containing protein [Motilimonas sp. E26]
MDDLILPLSEQNPCGIYLKSDRSAFRALRNAYNSALSSFRQLVEDPSATFDEAKVAANQQSWSELSDITHQTLSSQSKDLEILCWFINAQIFSREPLANTAQALAVLPQWIEHYWPHLHPMPPVEKLKSTDPAEQKKEWAELRTKPLLQLIGESQDSSSLYMPLLMQPLIGDISYSQYLAAERAGNLAELKESAHQALDQQTNENLIALGQAMQALESAETLLHEKCQQDRAKGLSFKFIKQLFEQLINCIRYLVGDKIQPWPLDVQVDEPLPEASINTTDIAPPAEAKDVVSTPRPVETSFNEDNTLDIKGLLAQGKILNRDHAFSELRKIADYFRATEPHSPVASLLERAIRWGYLSLPELLAEMVGDNSHVTDQINMLTGLDKNKPIPLPKLNITPSDVERTMTTPTQPPTIETPNPSRRESQQGVAPVHPVPTPPAATELATGQASNIEDLTHNNLDNDEQAEQEPQANSNSGLSDFAW